MLFLNSKLSVKTPLLISCLLVSFTAAARPAAPWVGYTFEGAPCYGERQAFGPYDYTQRDRSAEADALILVEGSHFNYKVEKLQEGAKVKYNLYGDIDYTLRAFPNHHRALNTVITLRTLYGEKNYKSKKLSPVECYLQRAVGFSSGDATTYMLYGIFLHKIGKFDESLIQYKKAENQTLPDKSAIYYNLGLLYTEMERYEDAKLYAVKAYNNKFPLQGLKRKLEKAGKW
jgi:tetratricopeptide (TPR) repeat protein